MEISRVSAFLMLAIVLGPVSEALSNPLEGRRQRCREEGEPIAVDHIDISKCYSCMCKNGYVECKNEYACPPTDGCHLLVEKTKDGCCRKCKGCIHNGHHYASHTEWTDPANPCKVLRCEAGVVTESNLHCHTPCANPMKPEPGKCCPTCPECKINGQIATDDRDVISDDPCLKCRCSKGRMTCSKKACPVLQCVPTRQVYPPGECCPRCSGTRTLYMAQRTCTLQNFVVREGHSLSIDKCTNCECRNQTSICHRAACPILNCAQDLQQSVLGSCCKQCIMPEEVQTQCNYEGKYYENGQSWQLDACKSCKCDNGMPRCAMTRCNVTLPCPPGTKLEHLAGECCAKCVDVEGVCMAFGDPHYKTFDGKIYTFQSIGKYQLVTDCHSHSFTIRVANEYKNRAKSVITTKRVHVRYGDVRVNLQQKLRVKLNKERIKLPYQMADGKGKIEKIGHNIELTLSNGIKVIWNGKSFLEVVAPTKFKNKLCGLCGNFNGNVQDELRPRRKTNVTENEILFANSWCVDCQQTRYYRLSTKMSQCTMQHRSEKNCRQLLSDPSLFGDCDSKLNFSKYFKTCKIDSCNCPSGKCYCDSLMAYARECERLGVKLPNSKSIYSCNDDEHNNSSGGRNNKRLHAVNNKRLPKFTKEEIEMFKHQAKKMNRTQAPRLFE